MRTDYWNYDNKHWCLETYKKSKSYIKNFRTAIDVGCREGDFSLPLVEDFDKVHAFDYRPRMKFENKKLTYYQVALGDINKDDVEAYKGTIGKKGRKDSIKVKQKKTR